jgi:hypothetical protein
MSDPMTLPSIDVTIRDVRGAYDSEGVIFTGVIYFDKPVPNDRAILRASLMGGYVVQFELGALDDPGDDVLNPNNGEAQAASVGALNPWLKAVWNPSRNGFWPVYLKEREARVYPLGRWLG